MGAMLYLMANIVLLIHLVTYVVLIWNTVNKIYKTGVDTIVSVRMSDCFSNRFRNFSAMSLQDQVVSLRDDYDFCFYMYKCTWPIWLKLSH